MIIQYILDSTYAVYTSKKLSIIGGCTALMIPVLRDIVGLKVLPKAIGITLAISGLGPLLSGPLSGMYR